MKDKVNERLERIWAEVTSELEHAEAPSDIKKMFIAYGFLENIILNVSQDIEDPEIQARLLNYCEFAMNAVHEFDKPSRVEPSAPTKTADILQFPKK